MMMMMMMLPGTASAASAESNNIGDVFENFETICFSYATDGYSVELYFLIENAGFKSYGISDGDDVYNSRLVQLIIGEKGCAFGIPNLPFAQMLEWTKSWADTEGLSYKNAGKRSNGGAFWTWSRKEFDITLEEDRFPDGSQLTGLVLNRK